MLNFLINFLILKTEERMTAVNNEEVDENGKLYSDLHYTLNLVSFEPWVLKKQKTW